MVSFELVDMLYESKADAINCCYHAVTMGEICFTTLLHFLREQLLGDNAPVFTSFDIQMVEEGHVSWIVFALWKVAVCIFLNIFIDIQ